MYCNHCGTYVEVGAYCPNCGAPLYSYIQNTHGNNNYQNNNQHPTNHKVSATLGIASFVLLFTGLFTILGFILGIVAVKSKRSSKIGELFGTAAICFFCILVIIIAINLLLHFVVLN